MEEEIKKIFGKKLQILLIKKGKRKSDLCRELNIPNSTFSDWCSGKVYPRLDKMLLLSEYFNMEYDDLVKISDWEV